MSQHRIIACTQCDWRQHEYNRPGALPPCWHCRSPLRKVAEFQPALGFFLCDCLNIDEAAVKLHLPPHQLLQMCEQGLIHSANLTALDKTSIRLIHLPDVESFVANGPKKIMTYADAVALVRSSFRNYIRRPGWPEEHCVFSDIYKYLDEVIDAKIRVCGRPSELYFEIDPDDNQDLCINDDDAPGTANGSGRYLPTQEDTQAADWYLAFPR